ncbi:MAG: GAF domain-containing protein [Chloroflexi bacterium]|nr:GAF domain-containing protein [Chloroflexota bacterium]
MPDQQQLHQELDILVEITEILTGGLPFLEKCDAALTVLARFTDSDLVTLREFDSEDSTLNLIAYYFHEIKGEDFQVPQSVTTSLSAKALDDNAPMVIDDYSTFGQRHQAYANLGMNSAFAVPIHVDGELFGSLGFGSRAAAHYQKEMIPVAVAIAAMVGMMVSKAELQEFDRVEARIGRIVSAPLVGPDVFRGFAEEAALIINYDRMALNSINLQDRTYVTEFLFGTDLPGHQIGVVRGIDGTGLKVAVDTKTSQRLRLDDPGFLSSSPLVKAGQPFLISVLLIVGDEVIGTLGFNRGSQPFSRKDLDKAGRLGNLIAGAFADFTLQAYKTQVEQEISKNRAILEAEAAIGKILSTPLDISGASEALFSEIAKVVPLDHAVIVSVDTETETFTADFREFLNDPRIMYPDNYGKPYAGSITEEVIRERKGKVLDFDDAQLASGELPRAQALTDLGYSTIMAVPLVFDDAIIGTLILGSKEEHAYSDDDMAVADRIGKLLAGALATFKITTERNRAQAELSESETRFRQIADSVGGVFWLTELEPRRLVYASPNFEELWGLKIEAVYEDFNNWLETIHPDDIANVLKSGTWSDEVAQHDYEFEYRVIKSDGSVRWIRSRGFPIKDENGKVYRICGIAEDVTDQKIELERITEGGRLLSIGELASGVAHEINNPLASINLYSESLISQDLPEAVIEDLKIISSQGKRAATIVRNLLQFARKSSPDASEVNARDFIDRCVSLKSHDFRINNISASTNIILDFPDITIDEQLMTQVIVNILTNAEQACVAAHGRGHISISVRESNDAVHISISDDGPGIPSENQLKIFDPFFTTKEVGVGTGLGLSVSYGIITQLGGRLWVESDGATGSTFCIEIPQPASRQALESPEHSGSDIDLDSELSLPLRVLVVDDEPDLRNIITRVLERSSHVVDQAKDGDEAWVKLQISNYDCILLDLRMPGTAGEELFNRLTGFNPEIAAKVIFVTGDLANDKTCEFLQPLANQVLEKPISIHDLQQALLTVTETDMSAL